ncbi:MAG: hypothetical protein AAGB31_14455 [Bdellovibrio sp.]
MKQFMFVLFIGLMSLNSFALSKQTAVLSESSPVYDIVALANLSSQVEDSNLATLLMDENTPAKAVYETTASVVDVYRGDSCAVARAKYYACIQAGYDFCWYRCYKK